MPWRQPRHLKIGLFTVGLSSIFDFILEFIFIAFYSEMKLRIKKKWIWKYLFLTKWNPNLAFTKSELKYDHFSSFWHCAWREKCIFPPFFLSFPFQGVHGKHFYIILYSIFSSFLFVPLPNTQKWPKNEFENDSKMAPRMATVNYPNANWLSKYARNGLWGIHLVTVHHNNNTPFSLVPFTSYVSHCLSLHFTPFQCTNRE